MNYLENMLKVLWDCVTWLMQNRAQTFWITFFVGVVLAGLCWWAATRYSRLFNLTFRITRLHQVLCGLAALLTLVFCVLFVSLEYTSQIADQAVKTWHQEITTDPQWEHQLGIKIYYAIKARGEEDFRGYPPPNGQDPFNTPLSLPSSRRLMATMAANEALHLFQRNNPFLSLVLSLPNNIPDSLAVNDINAFFLQHPNTLYPTGRGIELTAGAIKSRLDGKIPDVKLYARFILTAGFLLAQAIPFVWIGYAAYRNLKQKV